MGQRIVTDETFGAFDGVATAFPLTYRGVRTYNVESLDTVTLRGTWQGDVPLYDRVRSNHFPQSSQFGVDDGAAWQSVGITATANAAKAPDGTQRATLLGGGAATTSRTQQRVAMNLVAGQTYRACVRAKPGTTTASRFTFWNAAVTKVLSDFTLYWAAASGPYVTVASNASAITIAPIAEGFFEISWDFVPTEAVKFLLYPAASTPAQSLYVFAGELAGEGLGAYIETGAAPASVHDYTAKDGVVSVAMARPAGASLAWSGTLAWVDFPQLSPPSSTAAELALEGANARIQDIATPLRDLWNPWTCPEALLPWLAWALSIDTWKSYWPIEVKRRRVASAIAIQRYKGTAQSIRDVVASFGGDVAIREWWQTEPKGEPHTFSLVLSVGADAAVGDNTAAFVDDIITEVTRTKPVRSHFTFTQGTQARGGIGVIATARALAYARLSLTGAA